MIQMMYSYMWKKESFQKSLRKRTPETKTNKFDLTIGPKETYKVP